MNARLEKIENSEAYLEIELEAEALEEGLEKAYRKVVKQVSIPGFRKGKVPRPFLEAHFGQEILYEDAMEFIVPSAYEQAIDDLGIEPIDQPEFDIDEITPGKPFNFKVKVAVKPEVKLGNLEGLEITVPPMVISDEDVELRLEDIRGRYAQLVEKIEAPAELGDTVTIDFVGSVDGVPFEGGTSENYQLELGSQTFIPGFEEQLVGIKAGDTVDVNVTFPEEYHAEELAGKEAIFQTTISKIEQRVLRELDDEVAQEVCDYDNLEDFRRSLREEMIEANEYRLDSLKKTEAVNRAAEQCTIDIPPAMADMHFQRILTQFEQRLDSQGIGLDQYFQMTNSNLNQFKEAMMPEAINNARTTLMLEKIVEEKGFEVSDEELDKQINEIAEQMGMEVEQARQNLQGVMDQVVYNLKVDKAVAYLVEHAVITEEEPIPEAEVEEAGNEKEELAD